MCYYLFSSCHKSFDTRRGLGVHHAHTHNERLPNRTCEYCEKSFYSDYFKKYCSRDCLLRSDSYAGENNPNYNGGKEQTNCQICEHEFEYYPSEKAGLFCPDCVQNETWQTPPGLDGEDHPQWRERIELECAVCGSDIQRTPGTIKSDDVLCSKACHNIWLSNTFTGEGHPNWKGGGSEYYGKGWRRTRLAALERDGYACQICGVTKAELGRNPDVHHIVPVRIFVESDSHDKTDAHTLDNVVSLCVGCHRKADFGTISAATLRSAIADAEGSDVSTGTAHGR